MIRAMPDTGRPTDLTPEIAEKLVQAASLGSYRKQAAAFAGVDERTLRRWLQRGHAEPDSLYAALRARLLEAEARTQVAAMGTITKAIRDGDWKAAAWMLERRTPEQYSPRSRLFDPYRVLEILEEEGLVVDRDRALQALAAAEPGLSIPEGDRGEPDTGHLTEEERRVLQKLLRAPVPQEPLDVEPS